MPLRSGRRQGCPLSLHLFSITLEVLDKAKKMKGIKTANEDMKV